MGPNNIPSPQEWLAQKRAAGGVSAPPSPQEWLAAKRGAAQAEPEPTLRGRAKDALFAASDWASGMLPDALTDSGASTRAMLAPKLEPMEALEDRGRAAMRGLFGVPTRTVGGLQQMEDAALPEPVNRALDTALPGRGLARMLGGLAAPKVAEMAGLPPPQAPGDLLVSAGEELMRRYPESPIVTEGTPGWYANRTLESGPMMGAALATGNPWAAAAFEGGIDAANMMADTGSLPKAGAAGALSALLGRLPAGEYLGRGRSIERRVLGGLAGEIPTEYGQEGGGSIIRDYAGPESLTDPDVLTRAHEAGRQGAKAAIPLAGIGGAVGHFAALPSPRRGPIETAAPRPAPILPEDVAGTPDVMPPGTPEAPLQAEPALPPPTPAVPPEAAVRAAEAGVAGQKFQKVGEGPLDSTAAVPVQGDLFGDSAEMGSTTSEPGTESTAFPREELMDAPRLTSARNQMVFQDRKREFGLDAINSPERKAQSVTLGQAIQRMDADDQYVNKLMTDTESTGRALDDVETAAMTVHLVELKNQHRRFQQQLDEAVGAGRATDPEAVNAQAQLDRLQAEFDRATAATVASGATTGRALSARKITLDDDMSLASIRNRARTAKGQELTPKEDGPLARTAKEIEALEARIAEMEKKATETRASDSVQDAIRRSRRKRRSPEVVKRDISQEVENARRLLRAGCLTS